MQLLPANLAVLYFVNEFLIPLQNAGYGAFVVQFLEGLFAEVSELTGRQYLNINQR